MKKTITIRIDEEILSYFKTKHLKYQSAIHEVLRRYVNTKSGEDFNEDDIEAEIGEQTFIPYPKSKQLGKDK